MLECEGLSGTFPPTNGTHDPRPLRALSFARVLVPKPHVVCGHAGQEALRIRMRNKYDGFDERLGFLLKCPLPDLAIKVLARSC